MAAICLLLTVGILISEKVIPELAMVSALFIITLIIAHNLQDEA